MDSRKKGFIGTTVGVLGTLATFGGGVGFTMQKAAESAASCQPAADFIKTFVMSNFTIPSFNTTIQFQGFNIPVTVANASIPIAKALGTYAIDAINKTPDVLLNVCYAQTALHGVAYTAIATTLVGLLTLAYQRNYALQTKLEKVAALVTTENDETIALNRM